MGGKGKKEDRQAKAQAYAVSIAQRTGTLNGDVNDSDDESHNFVDTNETPAEIKLARKLAHNNPKMRTKAVAYLRRYLSGASISRLDMQKIWKGLFYCFWMSDKPVVQLELAENLAKIQGYLEEERAILYFDIFLETMQREWTGIDRLRMDKYMSFVRKFWFHALQRMAASGWEHSLMNKYISLLSSTSYSPLALDKGENRGLCLHFTDLYVSELEKVLGPNSQDDFKWKEFKLIMVGWRLSLSLFLSLSLSLLSLSPISLSQYPSFLQYSLPLSL